MYPVASVWDVLNVSIRKQPLDFWVIVRAENKKGGEKEREGVNTTTNNQLLSISDLFFCFVFLFFTFLYPLFLPLSL